MKLTIDEAFERVADQNNQMSQALMSLARALSRSETGMAWADEIGSHITHAASKPLFLINLVDALRASGDQNMH